MRKKRVYRDEDIIDLTTPSPSPPQRQLALPDPPIPTTTPMELEEPSDEDMMLNEEPAPEVNNVRYASKTKSTTTARTTKTKSSVQRTVTARSKPPSKTETGKSPLYTYSEYTPRPVVLYIRTEQEVDEALEGLDGCVVHLDNARSPP